MSTSKSDIMSGDTEVVRINGAATDVIHIKGEPLFTKEKQVLSSEIKESIKKDVLKVLDNLNIVTNTDFVPVVDTVWTEVKCPARVDLFGGWTDTPPICYEMGGSVVNMSVLIDGIKPISSRVRLTSRIPHIKLVMCEKNGPEKIVEVEDMDSLLDYNNPLSQGALLKACIVATNIIDCDVNNNLVEQLRSKFSAGLEVVSESHLPHGSGLGTSSILAAAICAGLWTATGHLYNRSSLLQVVLAVEQLLSTGGGWQDQVGGVVGGINRGFTTPGLPLKVKLDPIPIMDEFSEMIERHCVLLYTGKIRLAKDILDVVVSKWYSNCNIMIECFRQLHHGSTQMKNALRNKDLTRVASLLTQYWNLKKKLALNSEPVEVSELIRVLEPYSLGHSLLGAGGGGFLCIFTAVPDAHEQIRRELRILRQFESVTLHKIKIDHLGIQVTHGTTPVHL